MTTESIDTQDLLLTYKNGSYQVDLFKTGTKIRTKLDNDNFVEFPETIDVKITDYCDMGCPFCHEQSTTKGKHGDLENLKTQLDWLKNKGIELAIGGGNPLSHPSIYSFLLWAKDNKFICNLTVNHGHLIQYHYLLEVFIERELIKGLGISYNSSLSLEPIRRLQRLTNNLVIHVIAGVHSFEQISKVIVDLDKDPKILILGYKQFGFGENYFSKNSTKIYSKIENLKLNLQRLIKPNVILSFDNLAIQQLEPQRLLFDPEIFYMGDDFSFSMYIDAIKQEFAPTSRSEQEIRTPWKKYNLEKYWKTNH